MACKLDRILSLLVWERHPAKLKAKIYLVVAVSSKLGGTTVIVIRRSISVDNEKVFSCRFRLWIEVTGALVWKLWYTQLQWTITKSL